MMSYNDELDRYVKEAKRHKLLTKEEEIDLARRVHQGDRVAKKQLINANLRFVMKVAKQYSGYNVGYMDLIQEGNMGLIKAAEKFDPDKGYRFISYAVWWIKSYMNDYFIKSYSLVKMGTTQPQRVLFFKLRSTKNRMTINGEEPTAKELARWLSVKESEITEMDVRMSSRDFSVDSNLYDGTDQSFLDMMVGNFTAQDEIYQEHEKASMVRLELSKHIASLNEREKHIINHRIMNSEPETLQEIGDKFSISRARVGQIEIHLLRKLREIFCKTDLRPTA